MEQNKLPAFWDVAKAFKWAAEYRDEIGGELLLSNGQWLIISENEDGNENEDKELTPGNVAELYCLQRGFEKETAIDELATLRARADKMEHALKEIKAKAEIGWPKDLASGTTSGTSCIQIFNLCDEALEHQPAEQPTIPQQGPVWVRASERLPGLITPVKWRDGERELKVKPVWYMVLGSSSEYLSKCEWLDEGGEKEVNNG